MISVLEDLVAGVKSGQSAWYTVTTFLLDMRTVPHLTLISPDNHTTIEDFGEQKQI
jgi:hypothetical protein